MKKLLQLLSIPFFIGAASLAAHQVVVIPAGGSGGSGSVPGLSPVLTGLVVGNGSTYAAYAGQSACATSTFLTALTASGVGTCTADPGTLIGYQILTAGTSTYTPSAGTNSIIVIVVGGGGGGGGCAQPTSTNTCVAGGGGGGAFTQVRVTTGFSGAAYTVGAAASGGTAGANPGTAGNQSTITLNSVAYTAAGGTAGAAGAAAAAPQLFRGSFGGGTPTNGDIKLAGGFSGITICTDATHCIGGRGGTSYLSPGGQEVSVVASNTSNAGNTSGGFGGGGSGAVAVGTGSAVAGGGGASGVIIIYEYR